MVQQLAEEMRQMAQSHEFAQCHFLDIAQHDMPENALRQWVADGMYGDMDWMESRLEHRAHPQNLWPDVRSIIMLGMSYAPAENPMALADLPEFGRFSVYAQGVDYHKIVKKRLKAMARDIFIMVEALPKEERQKLLPHGRSLEVKVFVDTAPVMEKPLAQMAGLGWQGKHSNVVSRSHGNWLFLGSIFTNMHLPADEPEVDHCGRCSACMAACPTGAIVAPYTVDARKCISYLTIEHKGVIAHRYRAQMGNHIYGCDDCLAACPWNKFADAAQANRAYLPRAELTTPYLGIYYRYRMMNFAKFSPERPLSVRVGRGLCVMRQLRRAIAAIKGFARYCKNWCLTKKSWFSLPRFGRSKGWMKRLFNLAIANGKTRKRRKMSINPTPSSWPNGRAHAR